jgi:RNA polymerase sigma-70 factor (ECF subfamily)
MSAENESSLLTRPSLLARLKDWSHQTAWREFDHDYAPLVRNIARRAGLTDAEADEVAQETLIAVAKNIGEFEHAGNRGSFRAWLYQQARWRIADGFRVRVRASRGAGDAATRDESFLLEISDAQPVEVDPVFERLWDAEWKAHIHLTALARVKRQVSARQFQLFDIHVLQGLSVRSAAEAAGTTMAAVYMAKSRVARLVRREMNALKGP